MAAANPVYSPPKDLTRSGICNEIINEPKALPCLHTFCLECIREWSKPSRESVTCPIVACKKTTPMPPNGVDGLPGNVFVSSLIERSPVRGKLVPCVCCKETGNTVLARCFDCKGFLCRKGVDLHQELLLKSHQVIMLEDIKSGKVDLKKLTDKKRPTCSEHEGQPLWCYCQTCGIMICRDCNVVDHKNPEHDYVTLKSVATEQRLKIKEMVDQGGAIAKKVGKTLKDASEAERNLESNKQDMITQIDAEIDNIKKLIDKVCQDERTQLVKQQEDVVARRKQNIISSKSLLHQHEMSLQTALEMANQTLQRGSDGDIASMYKQLSSSLQDLCKIEPADIPHDIAQLPRFKADSRITSITSIGMTPAPLVSSGTWELESKFGDKDDNGKLRDARGISTTPTGDIVVANWPAYLSLLFTKTEATSVKVYSSKGQFKFNLDKQSTNAYSVVVNPAGQFYASPNGVTKICMFESDGRYLSQFAAISPSGVASDAEMTRLRGLCINHKDQLLVGEVYIKYISIHDLHGTHITSFKVSISPCYIAATSIGNIIVSADTSADVQILDSTGTLQHTINTPTGVSSWNNTGVCCSTNDEICISKRGTQPGVYCFSSTGVYLGCITKDVKEPRGVTLMSQDHKIAVVARNTVKIFRRK